jgi:hypothetical protein
MTARFTTRLILTAFAAALAALPAAAQVKRYSEIKSPPLPAFEVPLPSTFTLPNGLRVFLMEDHEIPVISVRTLVRTGAFYEPQDKIGLARLAGAVQRTGGTTSMPGDRIDDFLEARAASVETGIGGDSGSASMNCLKQDFDEVFKVYLDVLRNPAFAQDKLDIAKVGANASIARRHHGTRDRASRVRLRISVRVARGIRDDRGNHPGRPGAVAQDLLLPEQHDARRVGRLRLEGDAEDDREGVRVLAQGAGVRPAEGRLP